MNQKNFTILIVDDEEDILNFLGYNLKAEGYKVLTASNGYEAVQIARKNNPHLIILDVMMPGMDGILTCRELRAIPALKKTIIAFLTARTEDYSQIAGFESGADDYIFKPVKPKILVNKIAALLRRHNDDNMIVRTFSLGDLTIDHEKFRVYIKGKELTLPKKEFELLTLLTSKPDRVFTRNEILETIWNESVIVGERTIDVHIRKLREKLSNDRIKTIVGVGYKYEQ